MAINLPKTVLLHEAIEDGLDGIIDDSSTNTTNTWSSSKIDSDKQDTLVSATNIKTIDGETVLGSGDLVVMRGVAIFVQTEEPTDPQLNDLWLQI